MKISSMKLSGTSAPRSDQGLIRLLILILIALVVLGYYGISVRQAVQNPTTQDNVSYVTGQTENVWETYLKVPATYLWHIFVDDIWDPAITNLEKIKDGQPTDLQQSGPALPSTSESGSATATSTSQ